MKFLIVRTDRLGDTILTLPVASELKNIFPDSKIYFLCNQYTYPIVKKCEKIDQAIPWDNYKSDSLVQTLKDLSIDYAIIARPTFQNALNIFLSKIPNRIGTSYRWYSFLFNLKVKHHRRFSTKHEALYNLDLLEPIGFINHNDLDRLEFGLSIDKTLQNTIKQRLVNIGIDVSKPLIVLHISSGGSALDWNPKNFRQLAEKIKERIDCEIILTGTNDNYQLLENLFRNFPYKYWNLAGMFDLWELFHLYSIIDVYVGNSTGPTHLSAIAGCWVIAFFPKVRVMSQTRWGPITKKRIIFEPEIECSDCSLSQCKKSNCMDSIDVKKVFLAIEDILEQIRK